MALNWSLLSYCATALVKGKDQIRKNGILSQSSTEATKRLVFILQIIEEIKKQRERSMTSSRDKKAQWKMEPLRIGKLFSERQWKEKSLVPTVLLASNFLPVLLSYPEAKKKTEPQ